MDKSPLSITITSGTILTAIAIGVLVWLLFYLKDLLLIVLTAIVLASAVEPGVSWFMRHRFPRVLAVASIYAITFGILFAVAYVIFPPLLEDTRGFVATLPQYVDSLNIDSILSSSGIEGTKEAVLSSASLGDTLLQFENIFTSTGQGAFRVLSGIFGGVVSFFLIIVLSFYFAVQETGVDDFLRIIMPVKYQEYAVNLWKRSHTKIGLWMQGQLLLSLIVGVMVFLWLTILGVPYALTLAILTAIAELIPVFGSIFAGVAAVAVAVSSGGVSLALLVAGGFLVINQLESNLIYPLVVKKVVGVAPLLVILALIAGAQLAGFLGILLSVPLAAALQEFVSDVRKNKERELQGGM